MKLPSDDEVGYGKPPAHGRFRKGRSGNPRGRPRAGAKALPFDAVLGQQVTVREHGRARRMDVDEAFLLDLQNAGLGGDIVAARLMRRAAGRIQALRWHAEPSITINLIAVYPGDLTPQLEVLGILVKLDRDRPTRYTRVEPWAVQHGLAKLGAHQLTSAEQQIIVDAARTPNKVRWPDWWTEFTPTKGRLGVPTRISV